MNNLRHLLVADRQGRYTEAERHRLGAHACRVAERRDRRACGFVNQTWAAVGPAGTLQGSGLATGKHRMHGGPTMVAPFVHRDRS